MQMNRVYFHMSPGVNTSRILTVGLLPRRGYWTPELQKVRGPVPGGTRTAVRAIYLSPSIDSLRDFSEDQTDGPETNWSVFQVEIPRSIRIHRDPDSFESSGWVYVTKPIPPQYITLLREVDIDEFTWESSEGYV